jgi:hypothetical protein
MILSASGASVHILFYVVFTPFPLSHHSSVFGSYLSDGRGFVGPKKKTILGLLVFKILSAPCSTYLSPPKWEVQILYVTYNYL